MHLCLVCLIFFKINFLQKVFPEIPSVKQFGSRSGLDVIKLFLCSTPLSTKFILLINVKMPTTVGILTFIRMINTTSERLETRNFFLCLYFSFYEQLTFHAQLS